MLGHRLRGLITVALILLSIAVGVALPMLAAAHPRHHHRAHQHARHGIRQHGGGDHDADNFGAPSDGDRNR